MSLDALRGLDATILKGLSSAGLTDEMIVGGRRVPGYYSRVFVDEGAGEDAVAGFVQLFDCRQEDLGRVAEGDPVEVVGHGQMRIIRPEPDGTGRVIVRLGSYL